MPTQSPDWAITKATSSTPYAAGDVLDYTFTVVNNGNVTISSIVLSDAKCVATPTLDSESIADDTILQVGESQIWSCTSIPVTQAEADAGQVDNTVTATAVPAGGTLDPAIDDLSTPLPAAPSWDLIKSTSSAPVQAGDTLDYTFALTNSGNVTVSEVDPEESRLAHVGSELRRPGSRDILHGREGGDDQ